MLFQIPICRDPVVQNRVVFKHRCSTGLNFDTRMQRPGDSAIIRDSIGNQSGVRVPTDEHSWPGIAVNKVVKKSRLRFPFYANTYIDSA